MAAGIIEFARGDGNHHTFAIPADEWSSGGRLFFAAKQVIDDDLTDALAVIDHNWGDEAVSDIEIDGVAYKEYACYFPPNKTSGIPSNGATSAEFLGEFQWVPNGGDPLTTPPNADKLRCIVYFDVKRKTVV